MLTIIPLFGTLVLEEKTLNALPRFAKRLNW